MDKDKTIQELVETIKEAIYELRSWGSVEGQEEIHEKTLTILVDYPDLRDAFSRDTEGYNNHRQVKFLRPDSPIFGFKESKGGPENLAENHDRYLIPDE